MNSGENVDAVGFTKSSAGAVDNFGFTLGVVFRSFDCDRAAIEVDPDLLEDCSDS